MKTTPIRKSHVICFKTDTGYCFVNSSGFSTACFSTVRELESLFKPKSGDMVIRSCELCKGEFSTHYAGGNTKLYHPVCGLKAKGGDRTKLKKSQWLREKIVHKKIPLYTGLETSLRKALKKW